jgi:hypothetical protein
MIIGRNEMGLLGIEMNSFCLCVKKDLPVEALNDVVVVIG